MKQQKMEENLKLKFGKERLTEQLEKRHKERQLNYDTIHELKNQQASESEAVDYFENIFDGKIQEIENTLNSLVPGSDLTELGISFNQINNSIQELQKYLSNSTIFLTDYKIKMCQNKLNDLTGKSDELKAKLIPKKKFGFRNKKIIDDQRIIIKPLIKPQPASLSITETDNKLKEKAIKNEANKQFEWTIANKSHLFIQLDETQINNRDVTLSNLTNCIVKLHGHLGSLQMSNLRDCAIFCGPVARSIFGDNCNNCKLIVACQQMRLHTSKQCDLYVHVTCRAIIEDCHDIGVTPYNYDYPNLGIDFIKSGLDKERNNWCDIGDFNWLSPDMPSPNWHKISELSIIKDWNQFVENYLNTIVGFS